MNLLLECPYPLRNESKFKSRNIRSVGYGIKAVSFGGSRIWSHVPSEVKEYMSLNGFTRKVGEVSEKT